MAGAAAIEIKPAAPGEGRVLAGLVGALLREIMDATGGADFHFDLEEAAARAEDFLRRGVYFAFIAWQGGQAVGAACLYESHALYAEGDFGTIAELYVSPPWRSQGVGRRLLAQARALGRARGWSRLEVTTPPLPLFQRSLAFYEAEGFAVAGGRKLKTLL
jgi:GNAT superfamily N-acetyltransferase